MLSVSSGCTLYPSSMKITIAFSMRYLHKQEINFGISFSYLLLCNKPSRNAMAWNSNNLLLLIILWVDLACMSTSSTLCDIGWGLSLGCIQLAVGMDWKVHEGFTHMSELTSPRGLFTSLSWISSQQHVGLRVLLWQQAFKVEEVKAVSSLKSKIQMITSATALWSG